MSDLHTAAVHLDDLGSEGLDGSQDQLLVLKGRDAKAQYISVDTEIKRFTKISTKKKRRNLLDCVS